MAWIERTKKGWRVSWREPDGRRHNQAAPNHDAAKHLKADVEVRLFRGEYIRQADHRIPLGEWIESVIAGDLGLRESSRYGYRKDARALPSDLLRRPLGAVGTTELRTALAALSDRPSAQAAAHRILAKSFNQAVQEGILPRSPLAPIKRPRPKRREIVPLTVQELEALVGASPVSYRAPILLAAWGGLRAGEVAGLRVQDVDVLRRRITVTQQISRVGGQRTVSPVKTDAGRRTVTVPGFVMDELELPAEQGLVFQTAAGNPLDAVVLNKRVQEAAKRAGLRPVNFHLLRHTCAALMISQGAHQKQVQEHMGHSSISITMDVYGHLFPSMADDLAARMEAFRAEALEDGKVVSLHAR